MQQPVALAGAVLEGFVQDLPRRVRVAALEVQLHELGVEGRQVAAGGQGPLVRRDGFLVPPPGPGSSGRG